MPTETFPTQAVIDWLKGLALPEIDRLELDHLLVDLERIQARRAQLEVVLARRCEESQTAKQLRSTPGVGRVQRFPRARSFGQLLGAHSWLPQQRRVGAAAGADHQGRQRHGPLAAGPADLQRDAEGRGITSVVQADQAPAGRGRRPCGGDAEARHDLLAHGLPRENLRRVPLAIDRLKDGHASSDNSPNSRNTITRIHRRSFDPACPRQAEIPPVRVNSCCIVDAAAPADAHERVDWSGPFSEEFAQDRYASAAPRRSRSRPTRGAPCEGMCRERSQPPRTIATPRSDEDPGELSNQPDSEDRSDRRVRRPPAVRPHTGRCRDSFRNDATSAT